MEQQSEFEIARFGSALQGERYARAGGYAAARVLPAGAGRPSRSPQRAASHRYGSGRDHAAGQWHGDGYGHRGGFAHGGWPGRRWPIFSPRVIGGYGGWPDDVLVADPSAQPIFDDGAAEPGWPPFDSGFPIDASGELPATLRDTLRRLPAATRPTYAPLGGVAAALADPRSAGPGLYLIEFDMAGRRRAYSGQSQDVRRRLQQHLLCANMLGLPLAGHEVYVAALPAMNASARRAVERGIHDDMFARHPGVLTNQRRELEAELMGQHWL